MSELFTRDELIQGEAMRQHLAEQIPGQVDIWEACAEVDAEEQAAAEQQRALRDIVGRAYADRVARGDSTDAGEIQMDIYNAVWDDDRLSAAAVLADFKGTCAAAIAGWLRERRTTRRVANRLHEVPAALVADMRANGELGYVRPSDEWIDGRTGEPLPEAMQEAAQRRVDAGEWPEFQEATR